MIQTSRTAQSRKKRQSNNTSRQNLKTIQRKLWDGLHERVRWTLEVRLLGYIDQTIQDCYPEYCSQDGRVIDRRLARRIGVNPAMISRLRSGDQSAMTRLSHFLAMMNLCGIHWGEVGFLSPQQVVLDAISHLFPVAQAYLNLEELPVPTDEQILILYFASRTSAWDLAYAQRFSSPAEFDSLCDKVRTLVATAECDGEHEATRLVSVPQETDNNQLATIVNRYAQVWDLFRETFPFLGDTTGDGDAWGIF